MKITKLALSAAIAAACLGGSVFAEAPVTSANDYFAVKSATPKSSINSEYAAVIPASCACGETPISGCDNGGCDDACDSAGGCGLFGGGSEPWKLCEEPVYGFTVGGWTQLGYHTYNNSLFNRNGDNVNLQQAWVYAERVADGSKGLDFGARIDYVYGTDAQRTQAFGVLNDSWDNSWDNGIYGSALPQLYGEVAYGDLSVKIGHFFTLEGYEVVAATGNFFYSHSYTMFNSEPFTHTGVLASYKVSDTLTTWGGYVMGWDSGFEDNGDAFLGGYSYDLSDEVNLTQVLVAGRFGEYALNEVGWTVSTVLTTALSDKLKHVLWLDFLDSDGTGRAVERETYDVNNFLLYTLSDKLVWGNRFEWYHIDKGVYGVTDGKSDIYQFTTGLNYAATGNLLFRPEVRWDWDKDNVSGLELGSSQTTFGMDAILIF